MRIKLLSVIAGYLFLSLAITSCLDNEDDTVLPSDAIISKFVLSNIKTEIISEEEDTTTFVVTGSNYPFWIDQLKGEIYNVDSLPYSTDITKVPFTITHSGYYVSYNYPGKDSICYYSSTDSLDFTDPIVFATHPYDGGTEKRYRVSVNVHQVIPDTLVWTEFTDTNFPGEFITGKQKAILHNGDIYLFATVNAQVSLTKFTGESGWTEATPLEGITGEIDCSTAMLFNQCFYIIADGQIYSSTNGQSWTQEPAQATALLAACSNRLIGINNNQFIEATLTNDGVVWSETTYSVPEKFPAKAYSFVCRPLTTNPEIERITLIGELESPDVAAADTSTVAWSMLSTDHTWTDIIPATGYDLPYMERPTVIAYDGLLYAFGGGGVNLQNELPAFSSFYSSKDHGKTWETVERYMKFPDYFRVLGEFRDYSYIVDEDHFIWIFWSGEKTYWKGRVNRLGFDNK